MKSNRVNSMLTISAALAGLALFVLTPTAHGHGNNPKKTTDTEPDTGTTPPPPPGRGDNPLTDFDNSWNPPTPDPLTSLPDPGVFIGIDPTITSSFDVLSQVIAEPGPVAIVVDPAPDLTEKIDVGIVDATDTVWISSPTNVIPAPGTLALLGLAAAAAGVRRRRQRR